MDKGAKKVVTESSASFPDTAGLALIGHPARTLGQAEKAIRAYQRALSVDPDSVEAWRGLARAAGLGGDTVALEDARRTLAALAPRAAAQLTAWLQSSPSRG